jgi:hypothetical protein
MQSLLGRAPSPDALIDQVRRAGAASRPIDTR